MFIGMAEIWPKGMWLMTFTNEGYGLLVVAGCAQCFTPDNRRHKADENAALM